MNLYEYWCMLGVPAEMGVLRAGEFAGLPWDEASPHAPLADVLRVHDWAYVRKLQVSCAHLPRLLDTSRRA